MLQDSLTNAAHWTTEYGMFGVQYGARQIFAEIKEYLAAHPQADILLSSSWTNGTDTLARFFFDNPLPFQLGSIDGYIREYKPLDPAQVIIMLPNEREDVIKSLEF